jgi:hypothetical protein
MVYLAETGIRTKLGGRWSHCWNMVASRLHRSKLLDGARNDGLPYKNGGRKKRSNPATGRGAGAYFVTFVYFVRVGMGKYLDMANEVMGIRSDNRGRLVEFDSPLFGRCYGRIREVNANLYHITDHSVVKTEVSIPGSWVIRILDEQ